MPTRKDMPKSGKIYVLSIAISRYQSAEVSNLSACETDADQLKVTLQRQYDIPDERYLVLKNERATRATIIQQFRQHFGQLEDGDIAVFHYSGHGSWEDTSPEFVEAGIEHFGGRNEVMVVHDYGIPDIRNLADKELRWLISEIQGHQAGGTPKSIPFVGLMDCCYSGSIIRSDELYIRRTELSNTEARPLSDYLEGQYEQQYNREGNLRLPNVDYVMLSACGPKEYALETDEGGLFTSSLIKIINQTSNRLLSYAELFFHLRNQIQSHSSKRQNPFLHYQGQIHPYQRFLAKQNIIPPALPQLMRKDDSWIANIGALHGLQGSSWQRARIPVYRSGQYSTPITFAKLKQVALEHSLLTLDAPTDILSDPIPLVAGLHGTPLPISWEVDPSAQIIADQLHQVLREQGLGTQLYQQADSPNRLRIEPNQISLWQTEDLITGIYLGGALDQALRYISYCLGQMVRWEQVWGLRAPGETTISVAEIDFSFSYLNNMGQRRFIKAASKQNDRITPQIIIPYDAKNPYIFYNINIENRDVYPVYTCLFHLQRKFGIQQKLQNYSKPLRYEDQLSYQSAAEQKALTITDPSIKQTTDRFLLIASQEPLSAPHLLEQAGLGAHFGKIISTKDLEKPYKAIGEKSTISQITPWAIQQLEVVLVRS